MGPSVIQRSLTTLTLTSVQWETAQIYWSCIGSSVVQRSLTTLRLSSVGDCTNLLIMYQALSLTAITHYSNGQFSGRLHNWSCIGPSVLQRSLTTLMLISVGDCTNLLIVYRALSFTAITHSNAQFSGRLHKFIDRVSGPQYYIDPLTTLMLSSVGDCTNLLIVYGALSHTEITHYSKTEISWRLHKFIDRVWDPQLYSDHSLL
jgi:hypothetical protein